MSILGGLMALGADGYGVKVVSVGSASGEAAELQVTYIEEVVYTTRSPAQLKERGADAWLNQALHEAIKEAHSERHTRGTDAARLDG